MTIEIKNETGQTEIRRDVNIKNPIVPDALKVELCEWKDEPWAGKKFIKIKLVLPNDEFNLLLWPNEANCLMDMLKRNLDNNNIDLSYDIERAYTDLKEFKKQNGIEDTD